MHVNLSVRCEIDYCPIATGSETKKCRQLKGERILCSYNVISETPHWTVIYKQSVQKFVKIEPEVIISLLSVGVHIERDDFPTSIHHVHLV